MGESAVRDILDRIERLSAADRHLLEARLAERAEAEWQRETASAWEHARARGIDDEAIRRAIEEARCSDRS